MSKKKSHLAWFVGSIAFFSTALLIIPPLITKISSTTYKMSNTDFNDEELFPEPIIEKKRVDNTEEDEDNGRV